MKIKFWGLLWAILICSEAWGKDGDVFIEKTIEGVEVYFTVLSEAEKTCQVGQNKNWDDQAIARNTMGKVTIPATANGYKVIKIGDNAFTNCRDIDEVVIPEGIVSIGEYNQEIKGKTNVEIIPVSA